MKSSYIYLRVSTEEQAKEGFSVENQKRACKEYAQINDYQVNKIFTDDGKSAKTTDRAAFQALRVEINENPVDAVIIYKIDRFARNVGDFSNIRKEFKKLRIKLLSVSENGDVTEGLIGNIFASVAEWESEVNGQRTRDALLQKFREGWQPTPPPLGYRSVGGDRERKSCEVEPYTASIIKELFELYATGNYSIVELQDWLAGKNLITKNGTPLSPSVIHNVLTNPFYHGLIRWHGESKIGNHVPIITKELFETCQYTLAKHRNFLLRKRTHDFLLRGFVFCSDCGQRFTAEWHKNEIKLKKRGGKIAYYHCQKRGRNGCTSPYVEMDSLEGQVESEFNRLQFNEYFISLVVEKTKQRLENSRKQYKTKVATILNRKKALEQKRNKLEDVLLDDIIDRKTFKRKHAQLQELIENMENEVALLENQKNIDIELIEEILSFTRNIHKTYNDAPAFMKRHYLRFFFEKFLVKDKLIKEVIPTPVFAALLQSQQVILRDPMLPLVDIFRNQEIEFGFSLQNIKTVYETLQLPALEYAS